MSESQVNDLLREGVRAARSGDKEKARECLQKVVELDEYSEQGWFWLASVVETNEERRTCLGNVVLINPNNAKAQQLLDQLENMSGSDTSLDKEVIAGISKRNAMLAIAVGGALLLVVCSLLVLNLTSDGDEEQDEEPTQEAVVDTAPTETEASAPATLSPDQLSLTPPTITPFVIPPTLTPTPQIERSVVSESPEFPPAPADLLGRLLVSTGTVFGEYQPVFVISANDPLSRAPATLEELRGLSPSFSPDGNRFVYAQFNTGQRSITLQVLNINGTNSRTLSDFWNAIPVVAEQASPAWSPVGSLIAFSGRGSGSARQSDLYVVDVSETQLPEGESPLRQLTTDSVDESWPAWSPDGISLVYVADTTQTGFNSIDLRVINVQTGAIQQLTTDGLEVLETAPNWGGPDNNYVVYSGTVRGSDNADIWIVSLDYLSAISTTLAETPSAATTPEEATLEPSPTLEPDTGENPEVPHILIDVGPSDVQPRWSPDGRYIVFSSEFDNKHDIFIYDFETGEIYSFISDPNSDDIANDWIIP